MTQPSYFLIALAVITAVSAAFLTLSSGDSSARVAKVSAARSPLLAFSTLSC